MENLRNTTIGRLAVPVLVTFLLVCAHPVNAQPTEAEIIASVDAGVAWLVANQHPDGWWDEGFGIAETGLACTKLMDYATDSERGLGLPSPFDDSYIYRDNVIACVDWLLGQADSVAIAPQPAGDPDTNGNGIGIETQNFLMYENGIALMALCNTVELDRVAVAGPQAGRTYLDIAQDMADYLYFCQAEGGTERGSWGYGCNEDRGDQSVSGWTVNGLGFAAAEASSGCGLDIPQFVKDELSIWADFIQQPNGCSNYDNFAYEWHNVLKQGHLLHQLAFIGEASDSPAVQDAVGCLCSFYDSPDADPGWSGGAGNASYQATLTATKGLLAFGDDLKFICDPEKDWCADFDTEIVSEQNADGSWSDCNWGGPALCTSWALLTLERAVPTIEVDIDLSPDTQTNELSEDNLHMVTAHVTSLDVDLEGITVNFAVTGTNAATAEPATGTGTSPTDANGEATFSYTVPQSCGSLGSDTITGCTERTDGGEDACDDVTKDWIDTIPPVAECVETTNPHGKKPKAPGKGDQGQNQDGFYELLAEDNLVEGCAPLQLFVTDNGSGTVFGPFPVDTKIKYTQEPDAIPEIKPIGSGKGKADAVDWHIIGTGDAILTAVDQSGNVSSPFSCLVPPPPQ